MPTNEELLQLLVGCNFDYLYRQLAEECCELGQATLKMVRCMMGETPDSGRAVLEHYIEELADVGVMWNLAVANMEIAQRTQVNAIMNEKRNRMKERLERMKG